MSCKTFTEQNRNDSGATGSLSCVGVLTKEDGGKETWTVSSASHLQGNDREGEEAAEPAGDKCQSGEQNSQGEAGSLPEPPEKEASASPDSAKKSFVCKACDKSFHFYCRLKVHVKRCRVAKSKQVQCKECNETKDSKKELEKHQLEAHGTGGEPGAPKKKKKRLPVTCDLCGREFAHASGTVVSAALWGDQGLASRPCRRLCVVRDGNEPSEQRQAVPLEARWYSDNSLALEAAWLPFRFPVQQVT